MALIDAQKVETTDSLIVKEGATASTASLTLERRRSGDIFFTDATGNRHTAGSGDQFAQKMFSILKGLV